MPFNNNRFSNPSFGLQNTGIELPSLLDGDTETQSMQEGLEDPLSFSERFSSWASQFEDGLTLPDPVSDVMESQTKVPSLLPQEPVEPVELRDPKGDKVRFIDQYLAPEPQAQFKVGEGREHKFDRAPNQVVQWQKTKNVIDPLLMKEAVESQRNLGKLMAKMKQEGSLSPEIFNQLIDVQVRMGENLDPNNEAGTVHQYLTSVNEVKQKMGQVYQDLQEIKNREVDPNRYFEELPVMTQIASVVSRFASSVLKQRGFMDKDAVVLADRIQQEINQDINRQMQEINKDRELVGAEYQFLQNELSMLGNEVDAKLALEAKLLESTRSKISDMATQKQLTTEQRYGLELIDAEINKNITDLLLNMYTGQMSQSGAPFVEDSAAQEKREERVLNTIKELDRNTVKIPLLDESGRLIKDEQNQLVNTSYVIERGDPIKINEEVSRVSNILKTIDELEQLTLWDRATPGARSSEAQALNRILQAQAKELLDLTTLNVNSREFLDEILQDPTKIIDFSEVKRGAFRSQMAQKVNSVRESSAPQQLSSYLKDRYGSTTLINDPTFLRYYAQADKDSKRALQARRTYTPPERQAIGELQKGVRNNILNPKPGGGIMGDLSSIQNTITSR